jgi:glycosyltransferase involved in cell wall biosynthesis
VTAVTIAIPVHNGEPYLHEAIDSVLAQTFSDVEVVVIDNRSTDGTVELVRSYDDERLTLFENEENIGAEANWNRALSMARAPYFKLVCADDLLYPTCIERQVEVLEHPANAGAVMTAALRDIVSPDGDVLLRARGLAGMEGLVPAVNAIRRAVRAGGNPFGEPGGVLLRSCVITQAGRWNGSLPYLIDADYWYRVLEHGDVYALPDVLCAFRVHAASWSNELVTEQAAQVGQFFTRLRRERPHVVRAVDAFVGTRKAQLDSLGRRAVYGRLSRRAGGGP